MIEINLAPGAEGRRSSSRRRTSLKLPSLPAFGGDARLLGAGAAAVLLLLAVAYGFWTLGERRAALRAEVAQEVRDSTRFATTIALVESLQAREDTIRQKIAVIREVDQRRYVWPHLLDEISSSVPAYTWLTQLTSSAPADSADVTPGFSLQGNAASTQALTRLMKNLEASPFIQNVTLVTSEQQELEGRTLHRFTLEAKYEFPDSTEIETVPIVSDR